MTIHEALAQANKQLASKIDKALFREVFEEVRDEEVATIYSEVYKIYTPHAKRCKPYERRGEYGGLADPHNIEIEGGSASGGRLAVINTTAPNPGGVGAGFAGMVTVDKSLPELVEYGHGYNGNHYDFTPEERRYMEPRPFTEKTIEHLKESKAHVAALKSGLIRQGIKVK